MSALAEKLFGWTGVRFERPPLPEPEPVNATARPMKGFFAGLSDEQKRAALEYRGDENHGDPQYQRRKVSSAT